MVSQKPESVFQCSACGECCTSVSIPIARKRAADLMEKEWVRERLLETDRRFIPLDEEFMRLPLTDEGYCVFLQDKRCMIHAREGELTKPLECRRFPFAALKLPDGRLTTDASAACKTVAEELVSKFQKVVPQSYDTLPIFSEEQFPDPVPVRRGVNIDLPTYQRYEDLLAGRFSDPDTSAEVALKQAYEVLMALPGTPDAFSRDFAFHPLWPFWIRLHSLRQPYGIHSRLALIGEGEYSDPKIFGRKPFSLKGHRKVGWHPELDTPLKGYLLSLLRRKVLLAFGHRLDGLLVIATHAYFIARWYARTFALLDEKSEPELADIHLAIRLSERYYTGHQPVWLELFRHAPGLGLYLRMLYGNPGN